MKRLLLTGASGFIGRHTVAPLRDAGYEIHGLTHKEIESDDVGLYWHNVDLLGAGLDLDGLIREVRPTHLLHLAWCVDPGTLWNSPENFRWARASFELLEAFGEGDGQRAVFAGSCAEYDWSHGRCREQATPLSSVTAYGGCKNALQSLVTAFAAQTGLSTAWARIFFLFGPHERPERFVPSIIGACLQQAPIRCAHGGRARDFLHVSDAAEALVALLDSAATGAINIGAGQAARLEDMARMIARRFGRAHEVEVGPVPTAADDPDVLLADVDRLAMDVGWRPRIGLEAGLDDTIEWWRRCAAAKGRT